MSTDTEKAAADEQQPATTTKVVGHAHPEAITKGKLIATTVALSLMVLFAYIFRWRPHFIKFDAEYGQTIWSAALAVVGVYPIVWLIRIKYTQQLLKILILSALVFAGFTVLLSWALWYQTRTEWYLSGYTAIAVAFGCWVLPAIAAIKQFNEDYLPFILGEAEFKDVDDAKRCTNKKWVHYKVRVFWVLMVPVSVVLFLVQIAEMLPPGYILLMFAIAWGFVRKVVEEDTDPRTDLYPLLLQFGIVVAFVVVLVALFGVEPIHMAGRAIRWFDPTVAAKFYLAAAVYFLLISVKEVLTAWLGRRIESDGQYLETLSVFGRAARVHVFAGQVSDSERDVFEILLGSWRFFARSSGDKPIDHEVIFFGHGLDTLFSVGSTTTGPLFDRAEAELRQPTHAHLAGNTSNHH